MSKFLDVPWKIFTWVGVIFGLIYWINFWSLNLPTNYDSYLYTSIAKYMLDYGQFWTPVGRDGTPLFFKPPATYWQAMVGMTIFGQSIWASRVGLIVVHLLSVVVFGLILKKLNIRSFQIMVCMILFGSSFVSFKLTRNLIMENLLEVWVLLTLWLLLCSVDKRSWRFIWFSAGLAGAACLIKGFIVPAMYGVILATFLWTYRIDFQLTIARSTWLGVCAVGVSVVLGLAWPMVMYFSHGRSFWNYYFVGEHLSKLGTVSTHPAGLIFVGLVIYSLPFAHFVLVSVVGSALKFRRIPKEAKFFLLCLLGFVVLFLIPTRRDMNYTLPFVCVEFLLVGVCWDQVLGWVKKFKLFQIMDIVLMGGAIAFLLIIPRIFAVPIHTQVVLAIFVLALLIYMWKYWHASIVVHVGVMTFSSCLLWWLIFPIIILPEFPAHARPSHPKLPVCVVGEYLNYEYYVVLPPFLPNDVDVVSSLEEISDCVQQDRALVFKEDTPEIMRQLSDHGYIRSVRWYWIPPGQSAQRFFQAIFEADGSKIMRAYSTYIRP